MASVSFAAAARRDIKRISRYLAAQAGIAPALAFSTSLVTLRVQLGDHPKAYMIRRSLGSNIRVAVVAPYLVVYRHSDESDKVIILRVIHGHRNVTSDFLKMP